MVCRLSRFDVVLTTYGVVRSECELLPANYGNDDDDADADADMRAVDENALAAALNATDANTKRKARPSEPGVLLRVGWRRVVCDEAHNVKNHVSATAKGACHLAARSRWCLTGTPIHNKLADLYSYVR
jgi:transcription termination factor 2